MCQGEIITRPALGRGDGPGLPSRQRMAPRLHHGGVAGHRIPEDKGTPPNVRARRGILRRKTDPTGVQNTKNWTWDCKNVMLNHISLHHGSVRNNEWKYPL